MFIPFQLIPFVLLEKLIWHDNSACTVKSTYLKVSMLKQSDSLQTHNRHTEHVQEEV